MLSNNAMTTTQQVLLYLKKYIPTVVVGKALKDSGDHLTFSFSNNYLVQGTTTIHETVGSVSTVITGTIDHENGTVTFATAHTGALMADYTYLAFDYADSYLIEQKINAVSNYIEKYCGRKFNNQVYTDEPYTGNGRQKLVLKQWPITDLASVKMLGTLLNVPDYSMSDEDALRGELYAPNGWSWDGALVGLVGEPLAPYRPYLITYTAGYVLPKDATTEESKTLPYDLEEACIELISAKISARGIENVKSERLGDAANSYFEDDLPPAIAAVLDKYKRYV